MQLHFRPTGASLVTWNQVNLGLPIGQCRKQPRRPLTLPRAGHGYCAVNGCDTLSSGWHLFFRELCKGEGRRSDTQLNRLSLMDSRKRAQRQKMNVRNAGCNQGFRPPRLLTAEKELDGGRKRGIDFIPKRFCFQQNLKPPAARGRVLLLLKCVFFPSLEGPPQADTETGARGSMHPPPRGRAGHL